MTAGPRRWRPRLLALAGSMALLVATDLVLRVSGLVPPADPERLQAESVREDFFPFVTTEPGLIEIRPDWATTDARLRVAESDESGTTYLLPSLRPASLAVPKRPETVRVLVVGGSSAFGLYVGADEAFASRLQTGLAARLKDPVEVVNLGSPGWSSHRVANLLDTLYVLDPDLVVVYAGHNEMLDGGRAPVLRIAGGDRLHTRALRVSVLYRWMNWVAYGRARGETRVGEDVFAARARVFDASALPVADRRPPSPAVVAEARAGFGKNLDRMIASGRREGVPVVLVVPEPNLLMSPVRVERARGGEHAGLASLIDTADAAIRDGRYPDAVSALERAAARAPDDALVHYQLGLGLLLLGRRAEGIRALERTLALDVQTHRIVPDMQQEVVRAARRGRAPLVDPRPAFRTALTVERARELFLDHVHPTAAGHELLAEAILPVALRALSRQGASHGARSLDPPARED